MSETLPPTYHDHITTLPESAAFAVMLTSNLPLHYHIVTMIFTDIPFWSCHYLKSGWNLKGISRDSLLKCKKQAAHPNP